MLFVNYVTPRKKNIKYVNLGKSGEAERVAHFEPCREMLVMCTCKQSLRLFFDTIMCSRIE